MAQLDLKRIVLTTDHRDIVESFVADVVDLIPGVGEITAFIKGQDAAKKGASACAAALTGDIFVADVLPANLFCYLVNGAKLPELPKLP